ncbi:hypothetical protein CMT75_17815 [Elizabethkingia anophelis]|uniref:restriction endonuclease subunit S n=1 Tax=Elizabethkingia anophelis TaxID=1117645 RepID=UPI0023E97936|nr:restriction endonuclease subunit S [Elizabethkingia anophelis]MDV3950375.1 hypothetical protein [Elizabethkingia anophelis]GJN61388.1 type I restriction-modification system restriction endonuclease DNA specificity subunit HsdS [Elizabethkingia anophelis]HDP3253041.1 restriction endonuclease subunit S [Elizabethkingia anophelis]
MVETKFKHTDIGIIPEDWEYDFAGKYLDFLTGFPFKSNDFSNVGIKLLRGSNVKRNEIIWNDDITRYWENIDNSLKKYFLKEGDIVISMDGSLVGRSFGQIKKEDLPSLLVQRVARLRGKQIDTNYLKQYYCSEYFTKHCDNNKTSSAIPHISPKDILEFKISFPKSLPEQQAIAEVLSDTDNWIESLEKLIAKKQLIKQGAMQQLLTPREGWKINRLGNFVVFQTGFPFSSEYFNTKNKGLRLVKNRDLRSDDSIVYYSGDYPKDYLVNKGELLIGMDGDFEPILWKKDIALLNQRVGRVVPKKQISIPFLSFILVKKLKEIESSTGSTTVKHLSHSDVEQIELELPKYEEQIRIATILSDMDTEIEALEQKLAKAKQIKQGLMQELLTGRIRLA